MNMPLETPFDMPHHANSPTGAVARALVVLAALNSSTRPLSLAELSRRTGLPKSTVHRLLGVLCAYEAATRTRNQYFSHASRPWETSDLENIRRFSALVRQESTPFLVDLHNATGATASVSVLSATGPRHINQIYGHRGLKITTCSSYCTTVERVLRAYSTAWDPSDRVEQELLEVRKLGTAHSMDTHRGVASVAVPLHSNGTTFRFSVALSVCARIGQYNVRRATELLRHHSHDLTMTLAASLAVPQPESDDTSNSAVHDATA
ncbi:helix-turn-helix domain-containing protein [Lentzea sp. NPDC004782]|uniref:helix-turn-helix domain-containing protein n=1 Tax=Lentzea sp. NPDC004782 TaxID=3154458 RepID=UPI0033A5F0AD